MQVVWWTDAGRVLHKNPDCPPFAKARARQIWDFERGQYIGENVIHSFDFDEQEGSPMNDTYPPERYLPCRRCAR